MRTPIYSSGAYDSSNSMTLAAGTRLGPFEILSSLGAGGMGEVYRARDARLGRQVAVKVLPDQFAKDEDRLRRFEGEARSASSLSDPHIVTVFEVGEANGVHYFATELVEGSDLRKLLDGGPLTVRKTLDLAAQIASGLAAAHEKGIVHRDLKPENVLITKAGLAKIADFGLAKLTEPSVSSSQLPTSDGHSTDTGVVMGTVAYMSPEQARAASIDFRSDQFAFGSILYEMLSGKNAFHRGSPAETLAAILGQEPEPLAAAVPATPAPLRWIVDRCLSKELEGRFASTKDLATDLKSVRDHLSEASGAAGSANAPVPVPARRWTMIASTLAATLAAIAFVWLAVRRGGMPVRPAKLAILPPPDMVGSGPIDMSSDGQRIAFTAAGPDGRRKLYVREIDSLDARELPTTQDAENPFFSPDGRSIGFFAEGKLKRIELAGGPPTVLADAPDNRGGSWGARDVIVFSREGGGPIYRVSASGGAALPVTSLAGSPREISHRWPYFLPDGKHFIFMSRRVVLSHRLMLEVASVDGSTPVALVEATAGGRFARGTVWFLRGTTLLSQAFDPESFKLSGEPATVADDVWLDPRTDGLSSFALSSDGALAYRGGGAPRFQLTWMDTRGKQLGTLGPALQINSVTLSPDGRQALLYANDVNRDSYLVETIDVASGAISPIGAQTTSGIYSPDGQTVLFASEVQGRFQLYRADARGTGTPRPVYTNDTWKFPESWSPDGRFVSFSQSKPGSPVGMVGSVWILPIAEGKKPYRLDDSDAIERLSTFSPDGRFLAYVSGETGTDEIYVRPFPLTDQRWRVTSGGGTQPRWSRDGKELFFLAPSAASSRATLMSATVRLSGTGFSSEPARPMFDVAIRLLESTESWDYDVSSDSKRFLVCLAVRAGDSSPIVIATDPLASGHTERP